MVNFITFTYIISVKLLLLLHKFKATFKKRDNLLIHFYNNLKVDGSGEIN